MVEYVTSDTHFNHANVIKFCNRPYKDVDSMNESLVHRWNNVVKQDDIVYHLGDVGWKYAAVTRSLVQRLNGKKILCLGNHDKGRESMYNMDFEFVAEEIFLTTLRSGCKLLLRHRPLYTPKPAGVEFVLHGHVHNSSTEHRVRAGEGGETPYYNINCCVEVTNYQPISLEAVVRHKRKQLREGIGKA